jgi:hypothetical protein
MYYVSCRALVERLLVSHPHSLVVERSYLRILSVESMIRYASLQVDVSRRDVVFLQFTRFLLYGVVQCICVTTERDNILSLE